MLSVLIAACGAPSATSTPRPSAPAPTAAAQQPPAGSPSGEAPQPAGTASDGISVNPASTRVAGPDGRNTTMHDQPVYIDLYVDGAPHGYLGVNFRSQPTFTSPVYSVVENGQKVQANARGTTDS